MKKNRHEDIKDNALHKKLERVSTRDWWPDNKFNEEEFHIYCEAVIHETDLFKSGFISSKKYKQLIKMSDERLRQYLKNPERAKRTR